MVGMNVCCIDGNACTSTVGIDLCVDPFLQSDREDTEVLPYTVGMSVAICRRHINAL